MVEESVTWEQRSVSVPAVVTVQTVLVMVVPHSEFNSWYTSMGLCHWCFISCETAEKGTSQGT